MENKEMRNEIPMELEDEILEEVTGGLAGQSVANTANTTSKAGSEGRLSSLTIRLFQRSGEKPLDRIRDDI